jgi:antitoxin (DNA-binding transcriptional repressor) of toxin-antitoxin stability system
MDEMGIERARLKLGDLADRARIAGQCTMITRQGKPAAVLVPVGWYERHAGAIVVEPLDEFGGEDDE